MAQSLLDLARDSGDGELLAKAHTANANVALWLNLPDEVCIHAEAALAYRGSSLENTLDGLDPAATCLAYLSWAHWSQHRVRDALRASQQSLERARSLNDPDSLCLALGFAAMLQRFLGNMQALEEHTRELQTNAEAYQLATWQAVSHMLQGWIQVRQGNAAGIAVLQACAQGAQQIIPSIAGMFLHALAEAYGFLQCYDEQLQIIENGLAACAKADERFFGSQLDNIRNG